MAHNKVVWFGSILFLETEYNLLPKVTPGEKRLYQLKNKSLEGRAKGHLILTLDVEYNPIRAAVRTVNPREPKVMFEPAKFKRAVRM